jgi:hypothetical protein
MNKNQKEQTNILTEISSAIQTIKYGEVVITIHDSKIVEIEKKEKKRFSARPDNRSALK